MLIWFLPVFLIFLVVGLPVFFGLLAAPGILLWMAGQEKDITLLYRNVYNGMDSFPLMAIPFFMLAGEMMNKGGITIRLVEFSQALMGHLRGGLAHVNVLSSILFAGLSGSAVADTSALGIDADPGDGKARIYPKVRGCDYGSIFCHRPNHPAFRHHDYLCLCDGRKRRGTVPRGYCSRCHGGCWPHGHDPLAGRSLRPAQS